MNAKLWLEQLKESPQKKALPVLSFPSISLMGVTVRDLVNSSELQAKGMKLIADRLDSALSLIHI